MRALTDGHTLTGPILYPRLLMQEGSSSIYLRSCEICDIRSDCWWPFTFPCHLYGHGGLSVRYVMTIKDYLPVNKYASGDFISSWSTVGCYNRWQENSLTGNQKVPLHTALLQYVCNRHRVLENFLPLVGHFVWQSWGSPSDILGPLRRTFEIFAGHVWRDRRI